MNLQHERIAALCQQLKLDRLPAEWPAVAQTTLDKGGTYDAFLESVLQLQHEGLNERRRQTILHLSGLPVIKTLKQFDYSYASGVPRSQIQQLAGPGIYRTAGERRVAGAIWRWQDVPRDSHRL